MGRFSGPWPGGQTLNLNSQMVGKNTPKKDAKGDGSLSLLFLLILCEGIMHAFARR